MKPLTCARCLNTPLKRAKGPKDVEIDECPSCAGVWLDKSEIYYYASDPKKLQAVLAEAYKTPAPSRFLCRRCETQMLEVTFPKPGPVIDVCRACGGTWFDKAEIVQLLMLLMS